MKPIKIFNYFVTRKKHVSIGIGKASGRARGRERKRMGEKESEIERERVRHKCGKRRKCKNFYLE